MAYIGKSPTGSGVRQRYVYTATGGETSLSGADDNSKTLKFTDGEYVDVHLNGIQLVQGTDYGVGTANTINGLAALAADDVVEITVFDVYNVAKINSEAMRNRWYYTATGGETSLTTTQISGLSFPANAEIEVRLNGIALVQGTDFNTTTANTVGGLAALSSGNVIEIVYYEAFQLADVVSKAAGGTYNGDVTFNGNLNAGTIKDATGTNTGLTIDSSGRVFKPATPAFHAYASDNAYQTTSPIPFDTTLIDVGSGFDTTNNKYVVPVTGNYYIAVHVGTIRSNVNGEYLTILLKKGTTTIQQGYTEETSSQGYGNVAFSAIHPLTAGDELTVTTSGNGDYYASKTYTIFSGYLIG